MRASRGLLDQAFELGADHRPLFKEFFAIGKVQLKMAVAENF